MYLNDAQACSKIDKISKIWKVTDMNMIGTQNIETKRCLLRRIRPEDYKMMYENWAKYESVCRYFPFDPIEEITVYREKVRNWSKNYESDTYFHWVIESKENQQLIGTINLGNLEASCHMSDTTQYAVLRQDYDALTSSADQQDDTPASLP